MSQDRTPYTYFIRWKELDLNYYGRRTAKGCHPEEFFVTYFTSSKLVHDVIAEFGFPDIIKIHKIFNDINICCEFEVKFLTKINAAKKLNWLNLSNGYNQFNSNNKIIIRSKLSGKTGYCFKDSTDYINGVYIPINKNKVVVKDQQGNNVQINKFDEDYISGKYKSIYKGIKTDKIIVTDLFSGKNIKIFTYEFDELKHQHIALNKVPVRDKNGNKFLIDKSDQRWLTKEVVHVATGKQLSTEIKQQIANKLKKQYKFKSPNGEIIEIFGLKEFCIENNLHYGNMCQVAKGNVKSCKGWTLP